ncbi:MAG: sigma-54-dependent Fis family transcriptional regulator [Kouleothrix sp.]|jgi:DNA-binding NtrC family response regulator|nr:sigma-54-dependent Fis family transcriptional regulator [Kouleothrix sp.]
MIGSLDGSLILIADDEAPIRDLLADILEPEGARVLAVGSGHAALSAIEREEPDLAILDVRMPAPDGLAVLDQLRERGLDLPVIIITAQDSSSLTIQAMQQGAYDYIAKPFDIDQVLLVVRRAIEHRQLTRRLQKLEQQGQANPRDTIIGRSAAMQEVYKLIGRVAGSDATVLITGDSGTGKELVAQVLHQTSPRRDRPLVAVNCAALAETLLESELFGHEKGAFTGALAQRKGRFEQAHGGTLFLDEIGEISPATQKKLLRVLQERTFERVGGNLPISVDVRIISATNRDLLHGARAGTFRDDLYYRLNVINIHMPSLRERKDDIPLLINHFLARHSRPGEGPPHITDSAMELLQAYDWPGNVRQLENTIERAIVLAQGRLIGPEHLLLADTTTPTQQALNDELERLVAQGAGLTEILADIRRRLIVLALDASQGDRALAARTLGVDEATLF